MKYRFRIVAGWLVVLPIGIGTLSAADSRPLNFVFILMDGMGWRNVGFMGNQFVETPNIDRLAVARSIIIHA